MRIVIDMQGAQTESRFRGIGRYTMAFAEAVARNRGKHEIILALNGLLPESIEPIRAAFECLIPQENILVWYAPGPVRDEDPNNKGRREVAELVRNAFLASLSPDVLHVSSLFEGYVDDAVTSINEFGRRTLVSVILYDLIPLLNPDQYLIPNPNFATYYERKLQSLERADVYFAISAYTRQEGLDCLGVDAKKIVNISTAVGEEFRVAEVKESTVRALYSKFGLTRPFVLYTGGVDERKNLPRLIKAWSVLPVALRQAHQLLFAGRMPDGNVAELRRIARLYGLEDDELLFSGYVSDEELVQLYNLCKLYVFPSWHEGFGLPVLEAMACGAPAIGSSTTSLPEVVGFNDALFDPFDPCSISRKIEQVLSDEAFNTLLRAHGLQQAQKFSWASTARRAIEAWERIHTMQARRSSSVRRRSGKPRLAYVSPMPPERTGIADYSAELLPALSAHYDIELVVVQQEVDGLSATQNIVVRDEAWLRTHVDEVDRVLYQMGNSPFHRHMLSLLKDIPGTVVLHDFYLSGLMAWQELCGAESTAWIGALYESHGYGAVRERFVDAEETKQRYPANWPVLQHSQGVIVHSEYSRSLARHWYGADASAGWAVVPLLRVPQVAVEKQAARKALGIGASEFVISSFGFISNAKLNHRLLKAWLDSELSRDANCRLVFVGENDGGEYGASLLKMIRKSGHEKRIQITGFASPEKYRDYLAASDLAVQLRTLSRGETSAAVLDCMNHGLPLIVNANGSMAELDSDALWLLADEFSDSELIDALQALWRDPERRHNLGTKGRQIIHERHAPDRCAKQYVEAIERFHSHAQDGFPALIRSVSAQASDVLNDEAVLQLSQAIATTFPLQRPRKRLFMDATATYRHDLRTGIERVARAIMMALLKSPPAGYRVEPVFLSQVNGTWHHRYARSYTMGLLGCPTDTLIDEPIDPQNGDIILVMDIAGDLLVRAEGAGLFGRYRNIGVEVYAVVYDLLPIRIPDVFPPGADELHGEWIRAISSFDGAFCISKAVSDDLKAWFGEKCTDFQGRRSYRVEWWHLGSDVLSSVPSAGLPVAADKVLRHLTSRRTFLMVGTIEPRKGYLEVVDAFSRVWKAGVDVNLVIVGHEGWTGLPEAMRRDIPETVTRIRDHSEYNRRLFWLEGISDEYLERVYAASTCLIAASYGEGFGLPLIEAAQHGLPIIARDIPVFREVAGEHAFFVKADTSEQLSEELQAWLSLYERDAHPRSDGVRCPTWSESAFRLASLLTGAPQ